MKDTYDIMNYGDKFIVTKNGKPLSISKNNKSNIVTEFSTRSDAEKYVSILKNLIKSKY